MKGRQNALGYKHNPETLDKLRELSTNKNHSIAPGLNKIFIYKNFINPSKLKS